MNRREEVEQQIWEFVYDLLPDDQAAAVAEQITSEPDVARLYAEVKLQQELLAEASRLTLPRIDLAAALTDGQDTSEKIEPPSPAGHARMWAATALQWAVSAAAVALIGLIVFSYADPDSPVREVALQDREQAIAEQPAYTTLVGPERLQPAPANYFTVITRSATGEPTAADLSYVLYDTDDRVLYRNTAKADASGLAQLETPEYIPAEEVRLEVAVDGEVPVPKVQARLPVDDVQLTTHLSLDKPWYRPGDTVQYRSLTLSRFSLDVLREVDVQFHILTPRGEPLSSAATKQATQRGVACGHYAIPDHLHGGRYTLVASSPGHDFAEATRDFYIRDYETSELVTDLEFLQDSYGPGGQVAADFSVRWADGRPVGNASLLAEAIIDGERSLNLHAVTRPDGTYRIRFALPDKLERGDGVLGVRVNQGGVGAVARSIPIQIGDFHLDFYPEGGDLAADLPNRVYFHAYAPQGNPVHVEGRVVNGDGETIAEAATIHEGRGMVAFTPRDGEEYQFQIDSPSGVIEAVELPSVRREQDIVIHTGPGVFAAGQSAQLTIYTKSTDAPRPLSVVATCRGVVVGQQVIDHSQAVPSQDGVVSQVVALAMDERAQGVVRVTVYELHSDPPWPLAERLIYRRPLRFLDVRLADASDAYSPGQDVNLGLAVRDELGRPQGATLGVSVVDRSLLEAADSKTPRMTTHFWLTAQIEDAQHLEDANFYMSEGDDAAQALDLLLGTQGWRRFVPHQRGRLAGVQSPPGDNSETPSDRTVSFAKTAAPVEAGTPKLLADNCEQARDAVKQAVTELHAARRIDLHRLGTVLLAGAVVILFVLIASGLFRILQQARYWLPALGAAAVCLVVGGLWMNRALQEDTTSVAWLKDGLERPEVRVALAPAESRPMSEVKPVAAEKEEEGLSGPDQPVETRIAAPLPGAVQADESAADTLGSDVSRPPAVPKSAEIELDAVSAAPAPRGAVGGMGGMGGGGMGGMGAMGGGAAGGRMPAHDAPVDALADNRPSAETPQRPAAKPMLAEGLPEEHDGDFGGNKYGGGYGSFGGTNSPREDRPKPGGVEAEEVELPVPATPVPESLAAPAAPAEPAAPAVAAARSQPSAGPRDEPSKRRVGRESDAGSEASDEVPAEKGMASRQRTTMSRGGGSPPPALQDDRGNAPQRDQLDRDGKLTASEEYEARNSEEWLKREPPQRKLERGKVPILPVREYASQIRKQDSAAIRSYFGDSVFWGPRLVADADGRAKLQFVLSDAATTFEVLADAHAEGRIGSGGGQIASRMPFRLDPQLPMEITAGDAVDVPVAVVNGTAEPLAVNLWLETDQGLKQADEAARPIQLEGNQRSSEYFALTATGRTGVSVLACNGTSGTLGDTVQRQVVIEPAGYPVVRSYAGRIQHQETFDVTLPEDVDTDSLTARLTIFPSPVSQLVKGLDSLADDRTSGAEPSLMTHYADRFARQYIQDNGIVDPAVTRRMKRLLGQAEGESLAQADKTANTGHYYYERQQGWKYAPDGTRGLAFRRLSELADGTAVRSELLDGLSPIEVDALGLWARSEAGKSVAKREADRVIESAKASADPYLLALAALAVGEGPGTELAKKLPELQQGDGAFAPQDNRGSWPRQIESTALAVLALLEQSPEAESVERAIDWLSRNRQRSGGFGTPAATALALKALLEYERLHPTVVRGQSTVVLKANDQAALRRSFAGTQSRPVVLDDLAAALRPGDNSVQLEVKGTQRLPYVFDVEYRAAAPEDSSACPLQLDNTLSAEQAVVGDVVSLDVRVIDASTESRPAVAAVIGLPSGLAPRIEQLDELQEKGRYDYYEIDGRRLIFYWRQLGAKDDGHRFSLDLIAETPGRFTGPPSQVYLTASPEQGHWSKPLAIQIDR